jgi:N-acetylmuramoyl-L-alanine amidase
MLKKTVFLFFLVAGAILFYSFTSRKPGQQVLKTIIIDAGHGIMSNGGYNGAKGTYSYEDEICYDVSKKLVALVNKEFPNIKIVETRPTKYITSLHDRANIANQNRGDLFVSIHVNALSPIRKSELVGYENQVYYTGKGKKRKKHTRKVAQYRHYTVPNTRGKGTETYIWGAHKGDDKETAVRENAPMFAEENYKEKYGDIDPSSPEFIALSLVKTRQFTKRSATLANMVEEQFEKVGRVSGGPKQRQVGIWVLQATAMPSILVETGYITNPEEEAYLNSEAGQNEIAQSIVAALKNYVDWLEKKQNGVNQNNVRPQAFSSPVSKEFLQAVEHAELERMHTAK